MKQRILISAMLAAMLAIAGCGGGGSGISPEDRDKAVEEATENAVQDTEQKAKEAALKVVNDAKADIEAATTLQMIDDVIDGLPDTVSVKDKGELDMAANEKRNEISGSKVVMAESEIASAATPAEVTAALNRATANPDILESAHSGLMTRASGRTGELQEMARESAQLQELMAAGTALRGTLNTATGAGDAVTQQQIDDAESDLAELKQAIDDADDVDTADQSQYVGQRDAADGEIAGLKARLGQVDDLKTAKMELDGARQTAGDTPNRAQLNDVLTAHAKLKTALDNAGDDIDTSTYQTAYDNAAGWASSQDTRLTSLETEQDNRDKTAALAMTMKLWDGIGGTPFANNTSGTPSIATATGALTVHRVLNPTVTFTELEEDDDAVVADLHSWTGSEQTAKATVAQGGGTYTARLYSNVGEPEDGPKFNSGTGSGGVGFALANGVLEVPPGYADRVASPKFDNEVPSSGPKFYGLPDPNPQEATRIKPIAGSYYGVLGSYTCTIGNANCSVTKAPEGGYTLGGGGIWHFTPDNPEATVTEKPDAEYAVYGWWLHEDEDGDATVSAFDVYRGNDTVSLANLAGTATYMGGAAGKYAIRAGSVNDAGHFKADATLNANFNTNKVSGTIGNFKVGDDAEARNWAVELKEANINNSSGAIARTAADDTVWTRDGTAADASGEWSGQLYEAIKAGKDGAGTPQVGTGTFHSEYSNIGRMVGAFGVNLDTN